MRIDELVVRKPVTVSPSATLEEAARAMAAQGVGCLIVTEGDVVVGIVTDRDLVVRAVAEGRPLDGRVDSVMSTDVAVVEESTDVREVIRVFGRHAVRRLPVVHGRHLVGLVSIDELLVALNEQVGDLTKGLTAQILFPHAGDEAPVPAPTS
jgi:signal-transduction protein with cAMP-binding, CBS, and nucleotidyltransferase domain